MARQVIAVLLLLCLGLSAPAAGGSVRVCVAALMAAQVEDPDCCDDCGSSDDEHAPCCVELKKLPDAQSPAPMPVVPDVPVIDLGWQRILVVPESGIQAARVDRMRPIRGPTSAASRRAMMAIWRL